MRSFLSSLLLALVVSTAAARVTVPSGLTDLRTVTPGAHLSGRLTLSNDADTPAQVRLSQADYAPQNGQGVFAPIGSQPRSNGVWIHLGAASVVTVPPHGQLTVPYTLDVPASLTLTGSYWSVVIAEPLDAQSPLTTPSNVPGVAVRQVMRYALQVVTNTATPGTAHLSFQQPEVTRDPSGVLHARVQVRNDGEMLLRPNVTADVYGPTGAVAAHLIGTSGRAFPGMALAQDFTLPPLPAGTYQLVVLADAGERQQYAVRYTVNVTP